MTGNPLVSVIVPVYNGEDFIGQALESALLQTYRNLEIIVVDDGSVDGSRAIAETFAARDSRVRVIGQPNGGVARARNRAIAEARGELIAPLDADDLWEPAKIERQVSRMVEAGEGTGLVYSWWVWIDLNGAVLDRSPRWTVEGSAVEILLQVNCTGNASVPLFRRSCLEQLGGYDEKLAAARAGGCEDWDVVLRIAGRYPVAVVPEVLVGYRRRPGSMSSACDTMWRSRSLVTQALRDRRPDIEPSVFRRSNNQFALYLAGLSFWSGDYRGSFLWGLRASSSRLPFLILPYVVRIIFRRMFSRRSKHLQIMLPGVSLDPSRIPEPLIPYNRVYPQGVSQIL